MRSQLLKLGFKVFLPLLLVTNELVSGWLDGQKAATVR